MASLGSAPSLPSKGRDGGERVGAQASCLDPLLWTKGAASQGALTHPFQAPGGAWAAEDQTQCWVQERSSSKVHEEALLAGGEGEKQG